MRSYSKALVWFVFLCLTESGFVVQSYKILAIFAFPGPSHHAVFNPLLAELAKRGHDVTVYNTAPPKVQNVRNVDLRPCFKDFALTGKDTWRADRLSTSYMISLLRDFYTLMSSPDEVLNCKPLLDLVKTKEKYDLLLTQYFISDWPVGYAAKLNLPIVAVSTSTVFAWTSYRVALPENPSYIRYGQVVVDNPPFMNFLERIQNVYNFVLFQLFYQYHAYTVTDPILTSLFETDFPSIEQIVLNTSLILTNSHFSVSPVRPLVPAVVEIGGISIGGVSPLPKDIEKFMNDSQDGVVYFSMGSILPSATFPVQIRNAFLRAFSKLSVRIIWKFESSDLPGKPDNVLISKWLPQRSILAHPKTKLFISHCGQTSLSEAVHEAVPVLGVPIFADQTDNIHTLLLAGAGEKLKFNDITEETIVQNVNKILRDPRYKTNAQRLSNIFKDRPMPPLDTAMYWIEYVIRHKGAHHLRSPAVGMPWYQYFLVDVILTVTLTIVISIYVIYFIVKRTICKLASLLKTKSVKANVN